MINCMKTIMNAQKQFSFVSKDAKLKGDEVVLKQKLNLVKSQEYRCVTLILREYEQSYKIKNDNYELCKEVIQKIELLEVKRKADIPNYFQSVYDSINIFYHQTIKYFLENDSYKYK
ncbi:hypothetical protein H8356DRAFT_1386807 [Neocallimastix lanati (nom. inval.)]|nr:hypothetical protein H8356DRAFT_1386807 [Neocallimastix sp. JGI-2020a]